MADLRHTEAGLVTKMKTALALAVEDSEKKVAKLRNDVIELFTALQDETVQHTCFRGSAPMPMRMEKISFEGAEEKISNLESFASEHKVRIRLLEEKVEKLPSQVAKSVREGGNKRRLSFMEHIFDNDNKFDAFAGRIVKGKWFYGRFYDVFNFSERYMWSGSSNLIEVLTAQEKLLKLDYAAKSEGFAAVAMERRSPKMFEVKENTKLRGSNPSYFKNIPSWIKWSGDTNTGLEHVINSQISMLEASLIEDIELTFQGCPGSQRFGYFDAYHDYSVDRQVRHIR